MSEIHPHIETPHNPREGFHRWVFLNGFGGRDVVVKRDSLGRKNKGVWREWLVVHCDNIDCPAAGIIPIGMIHDLMESAEPVPTLSTDQDHLNRSHEGEDR